jgi:hypothetical protein
MEELHDPVKVMVIPGPIPPGQGFQNLSSRQHGENLLPSAKVT